MNPVKKVEIKKYNYCCKDVPDEFVGKKIAFLSDIHHGRCFSQESLCELVELTNSLNPDIIILGGDYVDHDPEMIPSFFKEAKNFYAPLGVYAVLGNHDRKTDAILSETEMEKSGITSLDNRAVWVEYNNSRIRIGGVGDFTTDKQDIKPMLDGTKEDDLMILVSHHPNYAMYLPKNKIDLMLCGHTHGGQVSFFGKWAPTWIHRIKLKYLTGVVKEGSTTMVISNGIGTVGPPVRIGAARQIWEIKLERLERNGAL